MLNLVGKLLPFLFLQSSLGNLTLLKAGLLGCSDGNFNYLPLIYFIDGPVGECMTERSLLRVNRQ